MRIGLRIEVLAVASMAIPSLFATGQATTSTSDQTSSGTVCETFDAQSAALLESASAYVASLNDLSFSASVRTEHHACKQEVERTEYRFAFERPNLFAMSMKLPDETLTVTADGHQLMFALDSIKEYRIEEQPEDLGTLVGWLTQQPALRRLFSRQLTAGWTENVRHTHCAVDVLDGQPCRRLEMDFDRTDVVIWFQSGEAPIPIKLTADLSRTINRPKGTLTTEIEWRDWTTTKNDKAGLFLIRPPTGFRKVENFSEARDDGKECQDAERSLVGGQAPPFSLALLDNPVTSLREHLGKRIVVLEFWATWCRPCRNSLRDMEAQLPRFTKGNALVYAVNLMESREEIAAFVKKTGLNLPVALDPKGDLAEQLHLGAVPTCVVIGQDGSIQAMHVGYDKALARRVAGEIDDLAQGKNLTDGIEPLSPGCQLRYRLGLDSQAYCAVFVGY